MMQVNRDIWKEMSSAPRDGSSFDVICETKDGRSCIVDDLHFGKPPMGSGEMILWGTQNFLSPYFTPLGWRARVREAKP